MTSQSATVLTQQETFSFFLFALCHCFRPAAGRDRGGRRGREPCRRDGAKSPTVAVDCDARPPAHVVGMVPVREGGGCGLEV